MHTIVPEKIFYDIFHDDEFGAFFYRQIRNFGWSRLIHEEDQMFSKNLVYEFYSSFSQYDIAPNGETIYVLWRGVRREVDLQMISRVAHAPLGVAVL